MVIAATIIVLKPGLEPHCPPMCRNRSDKNFFSEKERLESSTTIFSLHRSKAQASTKQPISRISLSKDRKIESFQVRRHNPEHECV